MPNLKFGWHMPSFPMDGSDGAPFVEQIHDFIQHIELDFDSVWVDDHMFPGFPGISNDTTYLECLTTIAYLATAYPKLTFGASVLCQSYRNPAPAGQNGRQPAAADRWALPLWHRRGLDGRGIQRLQLRLPTASVRIDQMEETIQIVKRCGPSLRRALPASITGSRTPGAVNGQRPSRRF